MFKFNRVLIASLVLSFAGAANSAQAIDYQTVWDQGYEVHQEWLVVYQLTLELQQSGNYPAEADDLYDAHMGVWDGLYRISTYMDWQNMSAEIPAVVVGKILYYSEKTFDAARDTQDAAAVLYFAAPAGPAGQEDRSFALDVWFAAQRTRIQAGVLINLLEGN